ncbi:hypothetical protein [Herbaspirillum sp.]|uniref:hypothetical protein n=1 Tax=Herbaspirillum sp. TaxID=1890675 RepID=UPI000C08EF09|nr:hypothetical protein [Herbaspirillum sp.]MAF02056.1 hypothetical protein [Herbaspirillum sp.]|tara:strand:+ start:3582 stop:4043 length:462 start_codon:yes stop_codon:yes gene_type:complete
MKLKNSWRIALVLTMFIGTAGAADWRPMPQAREGVFYDAQNIIKLEGGQNGGYQITERMYVEPKMLQIWSNLAQHKLESGAYVDFTFILDCSNRRAYQQYVTYYDHLGKEVAYSDTRDKSPSASVDRANFSDKPHDTLGLYNHLCTSKSTARR